MDRVDIDTSQSAQKPGLAERARDTATDASRSISEVTAALKAAVEQLRTTVAEAQSGRAIPVLRRAVREAPLTSLFAGFLLGALLTRRR